MHPLVKAVSFSPRTISPAAGSDGHTLVAFDVLTGTVRWVHEVSHRTIEIVMATAGGGIAFITDDGFQHLGGFGTLIDSDPNIAHRMRPLMR